MQIKSLKRIYETEEHTAADLRYQKDLDNINIAYEKAAPNTWNPIKRLLPSYNRSVGEAKADRNMARDVAKERLEATKLGHVSQHDYDDIRYKNAKLKADNFEQVPKHDYDKIKHENDELKTTAAAEAKKKAEEAIAKQTVDNNVDTDDNTEKASGVLQAIKDHPYLSAGVAAGLAGVVALQKRKRRLPEPGSYNN
jgi:hypothetical protein